MSEDSVQPAELTLGDVMRLDDDQYHTDNVALVTGGGSGIGRATSIVLAENGLTAVATDVDEEGLAETKAMAEDLGVEGHLETVQGNLRKEDEMDDIVEAADGHGDLRYLANIAGMQHIDAIPDFPLDQYDLMYDVMLRAPFYLSKLSLPLMREAGGGVVGNMASVHAHYVTRDKVAYNSMKFGLRGLTRSIAAETTGDTRSFSVSTGYVKTPLVMSQIADTAESRGISEREVVEDVMLGQARIKEMMEPVEAGNLFALGFSKYARHLNGNDLLWDGGYAHTYE